MDKVWFYLLFATFCTTITQPANSQWWDATSSSHVAVLYGRESANAIPPFCRATLLTYHDRARPGLLTKVHYWAFVDKKHTKLHTWLNSNLVKCPLANLNSTYELPIIRRLSKFNVDYLSTFFLWFGRPQFKTFWLWRHFFKERLCIMAQSQKKPKS